MNTTTPNTYTGRGDSNVAADLYEVEALRVASVLRREGVYVCFGNIIARMSGYNLDILNNVLWSLALQGRL